MEDLLRDDIQGVELKVFWICSDLIKAGLGFVRTNVRIHWNPFYKAFHRICSCRNEPNFW